MSDAQSREMIERQCAELVRLRDTVQKLTASNKALSSERLQLCERLVLAEQEIDGLQVKLLHVGLSSVPPAPADDEDEPEDGGEPDYDAVGSRESYEQAWSLSRRTP